MQTLPNLIIIGAMKSGTTALHNYLSLHPQIFMSKQKELDYFVEEKNWSKGLEWYKSNFDGSFKINGESSQNYTKCTQFRNVPERLYEVLKNPKLVYVVRDPIARLLSQYNEMQSIEQGWYPKDFNAYLVNNIENEYTDCSRYYLQIKEFLRYADRSNVLVITAERLLAQPEREVNRVFQFLHLDAITVTQPIIRNSSASKVKANLLGELLMNPVWLNLKKRLPHGLKDRVKRSGPFQRLFFGKVEPAVLSKRATTLVANYLKDDIDQFARLFEIDLTEWKTYSAALSQ